ncbi:uroporphyrinogen-III synthase [Acinetobacter sp. 194]|uniref:uroporphyrinogen-III synthase n=1 Tax=Acinetobacter shaoyimingii TaxID=2715164 RepID=UPI00140D5A4D|nr:uroporphyrinogen-III synthase [Acinetobacter shaoyimingii]NHB59169.1 uroporphyrinogen-III synthase [Acinetobacter shaoyimingii]
MLFINTRPLDRARNLTHSLMAHGYDVIDLPLLVLKARVFDQELHTLYQQLLSTQMIVVVSPTAVDIGMEYLKRAGLTIQHIAHVQWLAVGKTTALHLAEQGISAHVPDVETSEGMLSLPIFKSIANLKKIAFWRGEGGRQFMMQQCLQNNVEVLNFVLYERECPVESQAKVPDILLKIKQSCVPCWVCISSEASWKNWLKLFENQQNIVEHCHYLVLGERLYNVLINDKDKLKHNFDVIQIQDLNPQTILHTMGLAQRQI